MSQSDVNPFESTVSAGPEDDASVRDASAPEASVQPVEGKIDRLSHPSFIGFLATQFFGAFNDNLFKQLLLLLAIPTAVVAGASEAGMLDTQHVQAATGQTGALENGVTGESGGSDVQGIATIVFGIPFVVFGGLAGYLADRLSKTTIIVSSKVAEICVMGLGVIAFLATPTIGFTGLWIVLFLMGLQSTFFGPGKYGILPEMLPREQLGRANGLVLMTTFVAIIIGTAVAGPLKDAIVSPTLPPMQEAAGLWMGSLVCVGIAIIGTLTSLLIIRIPAADPKLQLKTENLWLPKSIRSLLWHDKPLLLALMASCIFWLIAGLTIQSVNSLSKVQLGLSDTWTSLLVALISVGIAIGGVIAGALTRKISDNFVIQIGMWGTVIFCAMLAITLPGAKDQPGHGHLLGFAGCVPVLMMLGASAAFFAIPIQVFLQDRPPHELKGRMIAVMNQANFFAIVISGAVYMLLDRVITSADWPRSYLFAAMALLFLPVAIFYKLDSVELSTEVVNS
ncbi:MFS transporter [Allorhodopirellula heiligendammensis]|uniref:Lysophospholipid transporter LplT n=1 Tax=Allorhodopirellula heiligendammensis TaxID=2714739 RepID=A0A5C6BXP9_9BACT|nr:MFS transporter [Allorhodopirellula heiligendammensis]TWU16592.1 Lysophospholipid transporter LplT [Allorhodopirellula heiligendammensis]